MSDQGWTSLEEGLRQAALAFPYPPTPDVAGAVTARLRAGPAARRPARRLAWALAALALLLAGLLSVPQVRAAVEEVIRIGVVSIFVSPPTTTPAAIVTATPAATAPQATARPAPTLASLLDLAGEVTLEEARAQANIPILLPAYAADLGAPDRVFLQDQNGPVIVLVWLDRKDPSQMRISLHILAPGTWGVGKLQPPVVEETTVKGQRAVWAEGPYLMFVKGHAEPESVRLIEGHVLIWLEGQVTYRLETDLALEEAVKIAESVQ